MIVVDKALTNVDVVVLALAQLGGATKKVHSEHIAARAYKLAPDKFSWTLPEYRKNPWPDKVAVKFALEDAKKPKNGHLVEGGGGRDTSKDGWRLTAGGLEWVMANEQRIRKGLSAEQVEIPKREALRFCKRLKGEALFKRYFREGNLDWATPYQFSDLLECSPDAPKETIQMKFYRLLATAHLVKDKQILDFLEAWQSRFSKLLMVPERIEHSS